MFERRLYFKQDKVKASLYAQNNAQKPIYSLSKEIGEDSDCWESDDQTSWDQPSVR